MDAFTHLAIKTVSVDVQTLLAYLVNRTVSSEDGVSSSCIVQADRAFVFVFFFSVGSGFFDF
jgi:hypothetical protein